MTTSLLPASAGTFERVMSAAWAGRYGVRSADIANLRTLWDPWSCSVDELPLLAWAWSVDIWNEAWTEHRKRLVVAEARAYHSCKTTVAGFRMALGYVDAELVRAHLPRQGFISGAALDPVRHAAWLAALPEIRIHRVVSTTRLGHSGFFAGRRVARSARRVVLESRRAELIRGGISTDLAFTGAGIDADGRIRPVAEQIAVPGTTGGHHVVAGGRRLSRFVAPAGSGAGGILSLAFAGAVDMDGFAARATWASLTPIEVTPRWVAETVIDDRGCIAGRAGRFVRPNRADDRFFWSLRLADGSTEALTTMKNRVGRTRTRRARYTLGLLVHAPQVPRTRFVPRSRLAHPDPSPRVAEIRDAASQALAARDTLFVDINSVRPLRFSDLATVPANVRYGAFVRT